jgi:imidazolonepropionase
MLDAGLPVTLATDYNPGSSPSGNMSLVVSLACIKMKMLPEEALQAATINGAAAMELSAQCGSISRGKRANLLLTDPMPSLAYLPYSFGSSAIRQVLINGLPF